MSLHRVDHRRSANQPRTNERGVETDGSRPHVAYVIAMTLVAVALVLGQVVISREFQDHAERDALATLAQRQRWVMRDIVRDVDVIGNPDTPPVVRRTAATDLADALTEIAPLFARLSNDRAVDRAFFLSFAPTRSEPRIEALLISIDAPYQRVLSDSRALIESVNTDGALIAPDNAADLTRSVLTASQPVVAGVDAISVQLERDAVEQLREYRRAQWLAIGIAIMVLGVVAVIFLRPLALQIRVLQLRVRESRTDANAMRDIIATIPEAVITTRLDGTILGWSPGAVALYGYRAVEMIGQSVTQLVPRSEPPGNSTETNLTAQHWWYPRPNATTDIGAGPQEHRQSAIHQCHDGATVPVSLRIIALPGADTHDERMAIIAEDLRERHALQSALAQRTFYDSLTNLPNRALLIDRLDLALARRCDPSRFIAALWIDIDGYQRVSTRAGHEAADLLSAEIARRLSAVVRPADTVARYAEREFVVLLEDLEAIGEAAAVAERIRSRLREPFTILGLEFRLTASIGVATREAGSPLVREQTPATPSERPLLAAASAARDAAVAAGGDRLTTFDEQLTPQARDRLRLELDLHQALSLGQFRLRYQPVFRLETGEPALVEALVRWHHPVRGVISPAAFIPLAEDTGLITPLGEWILREACRQVREWRAKVPAFASLGLSVNISPRQLIEPNFAENIARTLRQSGFPPDRLVLEINEATAFGDRGDGETDPITAVRQLGVKVLVDDFGVAPSSLAALSACRYDGIKVDQGFTRQLDSQSGENAVTMIRAIVEIARRFDLSVTAEGIETAEQAEALQELGCEFGQGYHLAQPVPPHALVDWSRVERSSRPLVGQALALPA